MAPSLKIIRVVNHDLLPNYVFAEMFSSIKDDKKLIMSKIVHKVEVHKQEIPNNSVVELANGEMVFVQ